MSEHRGWAPDDAHNEGLEDRKAATDRLNAKSNAEQQAASHPPASYPEASDPEAETPDPETPAPHDRIKP